MDLNFWAISIAPAPQNADDGLVRYCFDTMDRIGGMDNNPFLKSLREQYESGRGLSTKQFTILARTIGDNAMSLPDCEAVRAKLSEFVEGGFQDSVADPTVPKILELLDSVSEWRPAAQKGKKVYDDKSFFESLRAQFLRRKALSQRQVAALKRIALAYRDAIPDFDAKAEDLGLNAGAGKGTDGKEADGEKPKRTFRRRTGFASSKKSDK